jgi:hypothetical protein
MCMFSAISSAGASLTDFPPQSAMFFDLSDEDKNVAAHPPRANPHRGYSHVGMEKSSAVSGYEKGNVVDLKQFNCKVGRGRLRRELHEADQLPGIV